MGILTPGNIIVNGPLNVKLQWLPGHTELFTLVGQQAKKGVTTLVKECYCDEVGLLPHNWGLGECGWHPGIPQRRVVHLLSSFNCKKASRATTA